MSGPLYNYARWPNFSQEELACQHTGEENPNVKDFTRLMDFIQAMRTYFGVPFKVTSGYRHPSHPIEAAKDRAGQHTKAAIDIRVPNRFVHELVNLAFAEGAKGIGIKLHGDPDYRFVHIDFRDTQPYIWSYP